VAGPMRRFVDLHTHSTASDGTVRPAELISRADGASLAGVALTDHDTTEGVAEARAAAVGCPELRFVAGIELSVRFGGGTMHLLGLGIDEAAASLRKLADRVRAAREQRNGKILAKLQQMGVAIEMSDVLAAAGRADAAGGIVSRVHIAQTLCRLGCAATLEEAFARYIGSEAGAYVAKWRPEPADAIGCIRDADGAAVLAHPSQLGCGDGDRLARIVRSLIDAGLEGIEVYHPEHSDEQTRGYLELARRFDLLAAGGSDYHGSIKPHVRLGHPRVPVSVLSARWADRLFGRR